MKPVLTKGDYSVANKLFQQAQQFVAEAKFASPSEQEQAIDRAKNALSSAFANATFAEQRQLQDLQTELANLQI